MKTILVDAINAFVIKGEGVFEEMHMLLEKYQNRKIIVTNADDEQMSAFGLNELPYEVFTLKHNPEKTNPDYFKIFLQQHNLSAKEIIYFEHNIEAVKSAQSIGICSYHYDKDAKDLVALKKFIDENI